MAKFSRRRIAREVVRMLGEQPANQPRVIQQLAGYVIENKMTSQVDLLLLDIADELYKQQGQLDATVAHVFELSAATKDAITSLLKTATNAKSVELETHVDGSLLGGVVVRTPRHELDASAKSQLKQISLGGTV